MSVLIDGELVLYGFVGDDFWDDGFTASEVIDALAMLGHDADITVRINSGGGYTSDGIAIYNALKAHSRRCGRRGRRHRRIDRFGNRHGRRHHHHARRRADDDP